MSQAAFALGFFEELWFDISKMLGSINGINIFCIKLFPFEIILCVVRT